MRNGASQTTEPNVVVDPFAPPYNPNLHIGDLQDDDGEEYVVLVRVSLHYSQGDADQNASLTLAEQILSYIPALPPSNQR